MSITRKKLREIFRYSPSGHLIWVKTKRTDRLNTVAGSINSKGYRIINIGGKCYKAHRLIFLYFRGYMPKYVDHIDRDKDNNKILNLRAISHGGNRKNSKPNKGRDQKGVYFCKNKKIFEVRVTRDKKSIYLGSSVIYENAVQIYKNFIRMEGKNGKTKSRTS